MFALCVLAFSLATQVLFHVTHGVASTGMTLSFFLNYVQKRTRRTLPASRVKSKLYTKRNDAFFCSFLSTRPYYSHPLQVALIVVHNVPQTQTIEQLREIQRSTNRTSCLRFRSGILPGEKRRSWHYNDPSVDIEGLVTILVHGAADLFQFGPQIGLVRLGPFLDVVLPVLVGNGIVEGAEPANVLYQSTSYKRWVDVCESR